MKQWREDKKSQKKEDKSQKERKGKHLKKDKYGIYKQ